MKKKYFIIIMALCLLVGCGKKKEEKNLPNLNNNIEDKEQNVPNNKDNDKNLLDPSDVLEETNNAKVSIVQNSVYSLKKEIEYFYLLKLIEDDFHTITFICNGKECSNEEENLDIAGIIPSSGKITINEDGTTLFSDIVIDGYKCNIPSSGDITCTK